MLVSIYELLFKAKKHKYIKRIPVGTTKTGRVRYRYIYNSTHTVGGKNILDESHLKPGTKLRLTDLHVHVDSVSGDQVTFTYDDGYRKGESVTVHKTRLLSLFNRVNKVEEQIASAKAELLADIRLAAERGTTQKQLARIIDRLERLGGTKEAAEHKRKLLEDIKRDAAESNPREKVELPSIAKELLSKHQVDSSLVASALKDWDKTTAKSEGNPDVMYLRRLQRLERDGVERAVDTYNNALQRAAEDNAELLKAVEAYKDIVSPFRNPEQLNAIMLRKAQLYKDMITRSTFDNYGYDQADRGDLTYAEMKKRSGKYFADYIAYETKRSTGVDIQKTKQSLQEAFTQLNPNDSSVASYERRAERTPEAIALERKISAQIESTCKDFLYSSSKYKEGDVHPNHKINATGATMREERRLQETAYQLAHVEETILRAYPERASHVTQLRSTKEERAFAIPHGTESRTYCHLSDGLKTRVHELAHTLEGVSTQHGSLGGQIITHKSKAERNAHTAFTDVSGKADHADYQLAIHEAVTLSHLTRINRGQHSKYSGKERTYDDDYIAEYTGKIYATGSSEFVTMGVQEMFANSDPQKQVENITRFVSKDPHHFLMTYAILKGYTAHEN